MKHPLLTERIPQPLSGLLEKIASKAEALGLEPYLVGGMVRDLALSLPLHKDVDITLTGGDIEELAEFIADGWDAQLLQYPSFLTYTVRFKDGLNLDLITARKESYPRPGALPVVHPGTLEDDLARRDFSINAVAMALSKKNRGQLVDPHGGLKDLESRTIRVLHDRSFEDDPTRLFRAARYAARFGFALDPHTQALLEKARQSESVRSITPERVRVELEKIIIEKRPLPCLRLLIDWGILQQVHPGIRWDSGLPEDSAVPAEVYESNLSIWLSLILRENSVEEVGQTLIMLKFPSRVYDRVMQCQELYAAFKSRSPVITLPRTAVFPESKSFFGMLVRSNLPGLKEWWSDFLRWLACEPSLSGEDLKAMGYAPGPLFKEILQHLALKKFSGEVVSREDETRFVIDNFRRE